MFFCSRCKVESSGRGEQREVIQWQDQGIRFKAARGGKEIEDTTWEEYEIWKGRLLVWLQCFFTAWLIDSVDMSLSKLWEIVKDREAWRTAVHGFTKSRIRLSDWSELNWMRRVYESIRVFLLMVFFIFSFVLHDWGTNLLTVERAFGVSSVSLQYTSNITQTITQISMHINFWQISWHRVFQDLIY